MTDETGRWADDPRAFTRIMLRPLGSPLPLGFFAFCFGMVLTSALELGWLPEGQGRLVAIIGLAFVAPLELLACVLAYLSRDTAGGTIMGIFSTTWVILALFTLTSPPGAMSAAIGLF